MKAGDATPTRAARCDLRASLEPVPPLAVLAHEWLGLESRAQSSFFTAWPWIGHWLAQLPASVATELLRVRAQGRTVGLAIVCRRDQVRRALPGKSRALYVNCTGDPALDELTIEYNGLLAETGREAEVLQAAIVALAQDASWDELFLDGWEHAAQLGDPLRGEPGMRWVERSRRVCHYVDLAALPNRGRDYLAAPPRKARYKLRRAWREAEALGGPALDIAANPAQASAFLDELARLHQATWVGRGQAGAFANPFFRAFHTALVASGSEHVQLARLRVGDRPVGYLYNFIHRGRAYNYQSGFDFGVTASAGWRPGVLSHALTIAHCQRLGLQAYEFMAGDQHHKQELATDATQMVWATLQRDRARFRVESALRSLWAGWRRTVDGLAGR